MEQENLMNLTDIVMRAIDAGRINDYIEIQEEVYKEYKCLDLYSDVNKYNAYVKELNRRYMAMDYGV